MSRRNQIVRGATAALSSATDTVRSILAQAQSALLGMATPETALWAQFGRIGGNLTPQIVSNIMVEADMGNPARLVDLVHESRQKDGHLQANLAIRELALVGLDWMIEPPQEPTARERKVATQCEMALRGCDTLPLLIAHSVGEGTLFGHAYAEDVWEYRTRGPLKGLLCPGRFITINCNRIAFTQAAGEPVFLPSEAGNPDIDGWRLEEDFVRGKFVAYHPRVNGDVPAREGLCRSLAWMALFRNWDIRDWLQFGEMGWKPWRIGTYDRMSTDDDIQVAKLAMQRLTSTGATLVPNTIDIKADRGNTSVSGMQSVHREMAEFFGQEMSKAILGQTMTTEAGSRGARSLGEVQDRVRLDVREGDATNIGAALSRWVVAPFTAINAGESVRPGRFVFKTSEGIDLERLANAIDKLAGKVDIPASWVREQGGIREPRPDEDLVRSESQTEADAEEGAESSDDDSEEN